MADGWPWLWPWSAKEPLSGDVSQWFRIFSPSITVRGRGDADLEGRIVRDVATYGAQIGQLSEIVLALADGQAPPEEAVTKLKAIAADIAQVKAAYRATSRQRAEEALDALKADDPDGYKALVAGLKG